MSPSLYSVFTSAANKAFIDRIGALRHLAAHRGVIMPTVVVKKLDHEPTNEEIDADIRAEGQDELINALPEGEMREGLREMARTNARWARYEKGTVLEGVVKVEMGGKLGFINPLVDTEWNFNRVMSFLKEVFTVCSAAL